jgi:hypothetical protein
MSEEKLLKIVVGGNAKLEKNISTFSLPAGFSCPGALECLSRADPDTGKITDGKFTKFRCFAAAAEALYETTRAARWHNFEALTAAGGRKAMTELIVASFPKNLKILRIHVSGDFFSQAYFDAWLAAAAARPDIEFYAYTKSLKFWVARLPEIPPNLRLVASRGGKYDELIDAHDLPHAVVVYHPEEAEKLGLNIDHDDGYARDHKTRSFALLLHGVQAAGTEAQAAIQRMKKEGVKFSYAAESKTQEAATKE